MEQSPCCPSLDTADILRRFHYFVIGLGCAYRLNKSGEHDGIQRLMLRPMLLQLFFAEPFIVRLQAFRGWRRPLSEQAKPPFSTFACT